MRKLVIPKYYGRPSIGLALFGCTNRPFYHICVFPDRALGRRYESNIIEQIGTFDPLPNFNNEKLVALNFGRIKYWIGERNAHISVPVLELLGLSGLFPIHPKTYIRARDNREALLAENTKEASEEEVCSSFSAMISSQNSKLLFSNLVFLFVICCTLEDTCFQNVKIYHNSNNSNFYDIIGSSSECSRLVQSRSSSEPKPCDPSILTMSISPNSSFYQGNVIPDVRLNFSVLIFEHVETVDFRLQCLYAPNHEDTYCHDSTKMIVNNTWLWPCRMLQFRGKEEEVRLPFSFGYSCFRIYGQSHYMVNVTLQPQNCRSSLIFTAPDDINLFPDIADFYKVPFVWSPMLIVDTSEDDGIWFRIEKPKTIYPYNVKIDLFKYLRIKDKPGLQLHDSFMISTPSLGYKIRNTVKGDYVAYAYVPKYDCRLVCPSSDLPSDVECRICQHTKLNFTIDTSKGDFFWKSLVAVEDSWVVIVIFLLGVFTVCFLGIASFLCFLRKKPNRSVYVELVERPTVLVLYSDDTTEHSHAVAKFADLLASSANASVRIDINELISTGSLPSRWLIESMGKASSVLLVLSQASEGILNGRKLVQRRPFPDMFSIACDLVIQDCTTHPSSKSKFATVRFPYSPQSVPYHLEMLGLQNFDVPKDLALLTAFLHRLSHSNVEQDMSNSSSLQTFMESLTAAQDYMKNNPDFFENMWQFETTTETLDIKDLPPKNDLTVQEINPDTEGLLLPDDESNDEGSYNSQGSYNILPPGSDDSDID